MCFISFGADDEVLGGREEEGVDLPQPLPQSIWAVPVDIVELATSLEVHRTQRPRVTCLRLCHRFGKRPLSSLPKEILDLVIVEVLDLEKAFVRPKLASEFRCFQGRCKGEDHFDEDEFKTMTEELWSEIFCGRSDLLDIEDYTFEQRKEMVQEVVERDGYDAWDPDTQEEHSIKQPGWLQRVCPCLPEKSANGSVYSWNQLSNTLKTAFGLDVILLHEKLSKDLVDFLPDTFEGGDSCNYHTSGFLTLPMDGGNGHGDERPSLTSKERLHFTNALMLLGLKPHHQLSELASVIDPNTEDEALRAIRHHPLPKDPKRDEESRKIKSQRLQDYLQAQHESKCRHSRSSVCILTDLTEQGLQSKSGQS